MHVGVLALQGAFREHIAMFQSIGVSCEAIRDPERLPVCSGLVVPGGESTTMAALIEGYGFREPIRRHYAEGRAIWGTCAGAILLARDLVGGSPVVRGLELMDITVRRNAFGRQAASFESALVIDGIEGGPFPGVFIRAPLIEAVHDSAEVCGRHGDRIVAAKQDRLLATVFHPELTGDTRLHEHFVREFLGT